MGAGRNMPGRFMYETVGDPDFIVRFDDHYDSFDNGSFAALMTEQRLSHLHYTVNVNEENYGHIRHVTIELASRDPAILRMDQFSGELVCILQWLRLFDLHPIAEHRSSSQ